MKLFLLLFLPLSTLGAMLPMEFRQVMHDRIEEYAPGSYKHLLDLHGKVDNAGQGGSLSLMELVRFLTLLEEAQNKFGRGIKRLAKDKVNYKSCHLKR